MSYVERVIEVINAKLKQTSCLQLAKFYGLAEVAEKDGKEFPVCNMNGSAQQIVPDATLPTQVYFKLTAATSEEIEDGFGEHQYNTTMTLALFVLSDIRKFQQACGMSSNEAVASLVLNSLPSGLLTIADAWNVQIGKITRIGPGKEAVLAREFPGEWEFQNYILNIVAVGYELEITGVTCDTLC